MTTPDFRPPSISSAVRITAGATSLPTAAPLPAPAHPSDGRPAGDRTTAPAIRSVAPLGPGVTAPVPAPFSLTIVVPVYNEIASVQDVVRALLEIDIAGGVEIVVVDDGSTDGTTGVLAALTHPRLKVLHHPHNAGKGAAVRTALSRAAGTHFLIFDGDHEYDAHDIPDLVAPLLSGRADVVFGVRLSGQRTLKPTFLHAVGNWAMTQVANVLFGSAISDLHTCLKLFPVPLLRAMNLCESGFGLDTEIAAEMLRLGYRPYEVPISYVGRSKEDGKKITARHALECLRVLIRVRLRGATRPGQRNRTLAPPVADPNALA